MNLLVVAPTDLSIYDGTSVRISGQILSIAKYLERISIIAPNLNSELRLLNNVLWIKPKRWRGLTSLIANYSIFMNINVSAKIIEKMFGIGELGEVDVVHVHWLTSIPLASRYLLAESPLLVDLHGLLRLQQLPSIRTRDFVLTLLLRALEGKTINLVKRVGKYIVVPTQAMKEYLVDELNLEEDLIYVIPDGVDLRLVPPYRVDEVEDLRNKLGLKEGFVVTYVGTPSLFHGFPDLIEAFAEAKRYFDNIKLLVIVPRGLSKRIFMFCKGKLNLKDLIVLENVPRTDVYRYLYASDVLALPHKAGTQFEFLYSNKLLDYVASGRPIVGYNIKAVREFLKDYPLKILVKPNSPKALAKGIIEALRWRDLHVDGSRYLSNYDWSVIGKKLLEVYSLVGAESREIA